MKQQSRFVALAALALGLGLIATPAWADDFRLTNSSGGTLSYGCTPGAASNTVNNGSSANFGCSSGSFNVQVQGSTTTQTVSDACSSTQRHHTTASTDSDGALSLSHACDTL